MGGAASAPTSPSSAKAASSEQASARALLRQLSFKVSGNTLAGTRKDLDECNVEDVARFVENLVDGRRVRRSLDDEAPSVAPLLAELNVHAPPPTVKAIVAAFDAWQKLPRAADRRRAKKLRALIMGSPALVRQANALQMELNALPEGDREALLELRRKKMREQAARAVETYANLPHDEKNVFTDGAIELYSEENQRKREAIREEPRICELLEPGLERWWWGSKLFDDADHNEWLSFDEYKTFHRRLLRLLDQDTLSPKSRVATKPEDEDPTALEDFRCDADGEGRVTKETYLFAVFQLCDQWTETVELDEYVEFLSKGFDLIYGDLMAGDAPQLPEAWSGGDELHDDRGEPLLQTPAAAWGSSDLSVLEEAEKAKREPKRKSRAAKSPGHDRDDGVAGRVALIDDAGFDTVDAMMDAARDAQDAGAVGVVFASGDDAPPLLSGGSEKQKVAIPVVGISAPDAAVFKGKKRHRLRVRASRLLEHAKTITSMRIHMVVETIAEIYREKMVLDGKADASGRPRLPLATFVLMHFRRKFGDKRTVKKKYKAFLLGVVQRLEGTASTHGVEEDETALQWITLFAQLCSIDTASGRLAALPPEACDYCLDRVHEIEQVVRDTLKVLPHEFSSTMLKKMVEAKFKRELRGHMKLRPRDDVYATAVGTFHSLTIAVTINGAHKKIISVPALMSLYAVVYTACDSPHVARAPPPESTGDQAHERKKSRASTVKPMY
ncbi:hypothetical protein JL721_6147 [Aureococcus anophagefferens]|nr:hypothetical protein JL721_6147 [Aureococcus anophagefferens]